MAGKPDLVGKVFALREESSLVPPWAVQCMVTNQGTAPAGPFKLRLTIYDGAMFGAKPFWWCTKTITGPKALGSKLPAGMVVMTEFPLPDFLKHTDFGPNNIYALTIEGPPDESVANNNTSSSNKLPQILKETSPPAPPPDPWRMSVSGVEGKRNTLTVHLKNAGIKPTKATKLDLHLRLPKAGAATGTPILAGSTKIPAMHPAEERSVTVVGVRDFVTPQRGVVRTDRVIAAKKLRKFTPLVPFSLTIKGSGSEIGFGPIAGEPKGKIKFPGKK